MVTHLERPLATTVKEHIDDCITHYAYEDALFLAEMNHDKDKSDESLVILADCYYRARRLEELYHLLVTNTLAVPRLRYIFALCCFELKKHDESVRALTGTWPDTYKHLHPVLDDSATAPFALILLSKIYCKEGRHEEGLDSAEHAVSLNCMHWSTLQEYLYLGGKRPTALFTSVRKQFEPHYRDENEEHDFVDVEDENEEEGEETEDRDKRKKTTSPASVTPLFRGAGLSAAPAAPKKRKSANAVIVAAAATIPTSTAESPNESRRLSLRSSARTAPKSDENESGVIVKKPPTGRSTKATSRTRASEIESKSPKRKTEPKPLASRNSNSLRSGSSTRVPTTRLSKTRSTPVATRSGGTAGKKETTVSPIGAAATSSDSPGCSNQVDPKEQTKMAVIVQRMTSLSLVHYHFSNFLLDDAEKEIKGMSNEQQDTSQVMLARARIMIERGEYKRARMLLESHHRRFPHKVDGMEMLSTALWQEQDTHALSALATTLTSRAKDRPESWCAAANSFSLAKQHSQAVQCLERAIKLNPRFVYSYTLLGWELIEMDELEKAQKAFRAALCVRPRDYRAFYGLGMVHQKRENIHLAVFDIAKAISINPQNCILYCAMSSILHAKGDNQAALDVIEKALAIDPHSVAALYQKARFLYDGRNYKDCLKVLENLKNRSSNEANVYFLLGKVYKRLGDTHKALLNFQWASNMDPRGESMMSDLGEHFEEEGSAS